MRYKSMVSLLSVLGLIILTAPTLRAESATATADTAPEPSLMPHVTGRDFPSVFQAWNPIDMPTEYPQETVEQRIQAAAKHDVYWEEPISQLSYGVQLALGAIWDHKYPGLATGFTKDSAGQGSEESGSNAGTEPAHGLPRGSTLAGCTGQLPS